MFGILFRSIVGQLLKVLVVTTAVLVTIIAAGAAIKPLSENLLGPVDLLHYSLVATVPMLQYALPFAAAFAGVIVHHRLASDNEILAMATSGLSYRRILLPAFVLGLLLTGVMYVLVDVGAPSFYQALRRIRVSDFTGVLVHKINRGEGLRFGGKEIYADEAHMIPAPEDTGAQQRLLLVGVAAVDLSPEGQARREVAARYATVDVHRVGDASYMKIALQDAASYNRGDGSIAGARIVRPEVLALGFSGEQRLKGLRFLELVTLPERLASYPTIVARRLQLSDVLAAADAWNLLDEGFTSGRPVLFDAPDGSRWSAEGARLIGNRLLPAAGEGGSIRLRQTDDASGGQGRHRMDASARGGTITFVAIGSGGESEGAARFDVILEEATIRDAGAGATNRRMLRFAELTPHGARARDREQATNEDLLAEADRVADSFAVGPIESLREAARVHAGELRKEIREVSAERIARLTQRVAQMWTVLLMLLFASITAILLRRRPALFAYLIVFLPAIATIMLISGGEQMLRDGTSIAGFALAWSGNAMLLLGCIGGWVILRRH